MSMPPQLAPPLWREGDRELVLTILDRLDERGSFDSISLKSAIERHIHQVEALGELLDLYPSLFKTQTLGGRSKRNAQTLIDQLANATPFTLDLMLPMRAVTGKTFLLARLNFMRLLSHVARTELAEAEGVKDLEDRLNGEISRCVLARVAEELLMSVVCKRHVPQETRRRAAMGLTHLWEDRVHFPMREFFPLLEATWEARRRILVTYGTLSGTAEIFDLMAQGCNEDFVDYFISGKATEDAVEAFREFIFGLSTEELNRLDRKRNEDGRSGVVSAIDVSEALAPESLAVVRPDDLATGIYVFFMKRHLESTARHVGNLPGPKATAEEYVMIEFLSRHDPTIFGEE